MGQFCSSEDDDQVAADRYAYLVSRFNNRHSDRRRYAGPSFSGGDTSHLTAVGDNDDDDWDVLTRESSTKRMAEAGGIYSPPSLPSSRMTARPASCCMISSFV